MNEYDIWFVDSRFIRINTDFTLTDFLRFIKDRECKIIGDEILNFNYVVRIFKHESK